MPAWRDRVGWEEDKSRARMIVRCQDCEYSYKGPGGRETRVDVRKHVADTGHLVAVRMSHVRIYAGKA